MEKKINYEFDSYDKFGNLNGKYFVSNPNSKSGWKVEEWINKIKSYENN